MTPEDFMRIALEEAMKGDMPFGAVIVRDNEVVARAHNTVRRDSDPSAHAEVNVIRNLTRELKNPSLEGYTLYATGEPCPMCAATCVWAGISEIIYAASIQDLMDAGVNQIEISCEEVIARGFRKINLSKGLLREESVRLFK